jgi:hypothetical protein
MTRSARFSHAAILEKWQAKQHLSAGLSIFQGVESPCQIGDLGRVRAVYA